MKKNVSIITTVLLCYIMMTGCNPKKATIYTDTENDITFDSIVVSEIYHLLGDSTNPFCTLEASFIYPADYKDKVILDKLNRHFINSFFGEDAVSPTPKDAMHKYIQRYIADYKELESDFINETKTTGEKPSQESWFAYYEMTSNEILYNKSDLLCFTVCIEYYTGGAHGGHGYNNHALCLKTGKMLKETDIFIDNYHNDLAQLIVDAIASYNNVTNPEELESMGYFSIKEIYPNDNFCIDENGITYTFNEYEIAAYFVGRTDAFLPYEKIRHLLREESPVTPIAFRK